MMRHIKKRRLYYVSGVALLMLLILPLRNLVIDVFADQTTTGSVVIANLTLARSITNTAGESVTGNITRGETYNLKYTITPQPVTSNTTPSILQKNVSNLRFEEHLPAHITILPADLPTGFSISGTMDNGGLLLTGSLPDISYTWSTEGQAFIPDHSTSETQKVISVAIPFKATISGDFVFNKATLKYTDFILTNSSSSTAPAASTSTPGAPVSTFDLSKSTSSSPLGIAGDYNAFIFGDTTMPGGGKISGSLASGGNVYLRQMTINETESNILPKAPYAVVAGKDIDFQQGTIYGNILYGGTKISIGTIDKGTVTKGVFISPNDFIAARTYYKNLSNSLAVIKANGTTLPQYGGLYLSSNSSKAVFDIKNSEFDQINWTNLDNVKNAKTILFNFRDENIVFNKGFALPAGITAKQVIFNFPIATTLDIRGPEVSGSIIAPLADLTFINGGQIHGNVIAEKLTASSLIDYYSYNAELPKPEATATPTPSPVPTAVPTATLVFSPMKLTVIQPVTGIQLTGTTLVVGEHKQITAIVVPSNASITALQWSSADPAIATVDQSGQVTGVAAGTARITASATDGSGVSRTVDVLVKNVAITDIQLEGATLNVGENKQLTATVVPSNATNPVLQWSSTEPGIVIVDQNGQITGVAPGAARITASATDGSGLSRTVDVLVNKVAVTDILLEGTTLIVDESKQLNATIVPSNASITTLQWSSANPGIVTVDQSGQVTGVAAGTAQITANATDGSGVSRTVNVLVKNAAVEVTDILLQGANLTVNESKQLNATVVPTNASLPVLEWSSNKTGIVTVDESGMVTGIAEGIAQITASATDGSGVSRTVDVVVNFQRTLTIVGENSTTIKTGLDLTADYTGPAGETGMNYEWTIVSGATGSTLNPKSGKNTIFTAASPGEYTVQLSFTSDIITTPIIETKQISVSKILLTDFDLNGAKQVYAGRNLNLSLDLKPKNADIDASEIIWSISGDNAGTFASLSNTDATKLGNTLVAKMVKTDPSGNALKTTVTVSATIGSITKDIKVDIIPMTIRFSKNTISIPASNKLSEDNLLNPLLWLYPSDIPVDELVWTSSNNSVASFANIHDGIIIGHTPGNVLVTVSYTPSQYTDPVSATIIVQVKLPDNKDKY